LQQQIGADESFEKFAAAHWQMISEQSTTVRCYLVRHGDALAAHIDAQRPLSARGREQVTELARLALGREVQVAEIRHSGILRAQQTAEILAGYLTPARGVCQSAGLLPEDDPEIGKAELDAADRSIMLVGHLPHMNRLAALLVKSAAPSTIEFTPATMLCCSKVGALWQIEWRMAP
jgi:phosphohistidine phosphatase